MKKSEIYGIISSVVACLLLFLLLWFVHMRINVPVEDEGIMVSFGNADSGAGYAEDMMARTTPVSPPPVESRPSQNDLMTQEDPSLALPEESEEERKRKAEQAEWQRKQREEQERLAAEKRAQEAALAEQRRKEHEAIDKANKLGGLFGNKPNGSGSGSSQGDKYEGNPLGKGTSGGNSWSLNGRNLVGRISTPAYERNLEGTVVVSIRVDASGKVVSATIGGGTISDPTLREAARKAALTTRFSAGKGEASGSITFNFRLK